MGVHHQYLLIQSEDRIQEVINWARTGAYLSDPDLAVDGISPCEVLDDACETYAWYPYDAEPGYADTPGDSGNYLSGARAAVQVNDTFEVIDRVEFDAIPALAAIVGWGTGGTAASYQFGTQMIISINNTLAAPIGVAPSSVGIPGLTTGIKVWRRAKVTIATALCEYWYSFDDVNYDENVTWIPLGTPQVGSNAGTTPGTAGSENPIINALADGQIYHVKEIVDGEVTYLITSGDFPPDTASAFQATVGGTVTIVRSGSPDTMTVPEVPTISFCGEGVELAFDTPATDPAPWYNANYPESADALGFFITEWTGLGEGHVSRPSSNVGNYGGGVRLGRSSADGRVMKLNFILFARSEESMIYLFDWLGATLTGVCGGCADESILIRRTCGSIANPRKGLGEMRRVGVTTGLEWLADLVPRGSCFLRAASVTLTVGDPAIYLPDTNVPAAPDDQIADLPDCFDNVTINGTRIPCRPGCVELEDTCRTILSFEADPMGAMAPIVTMINDHDEATIPMRVIVYADPLEIGHSPNPCGLAILGEIYVRPLPPWSSMVWDVAGRTVLYRDVTTGVLTETYAYLDENDPPIPRDFTLGCGHFHLVLEPGSLCGEWTLGQFTWNGIEFDDPHYPEVSLRLQERVGGGG